MRYELRRIEIWPVVKIVFILSLFLGFSLSEEALYGGRQYSGAVVAVVFVVMCTILIPIIYTVFSVIFVALYNLVASWFGGFRVEFQSIDDQDGDHSPVG